MAANDPDDWLVPFCPLRLAASDARLPVIGRFINGEQSLLGHCGGQMQRTDEWRSFTQEARDDPRRLRAERRHVGSNGRQKADDRAHAPGQDNESRVHHRPNRRDAQGHESGLLVQEPRRERVAGRRRLGDRLEP